MPPRNPFYDPFSKPYADNSEAPPISFYILGNDNNHMQRIHCIHCKRIIVDLKGTISTIISTPMPVADFEVGLNIRCKLCKQDYRFLVNGLVAQVL